MRSIVDKILLWIKAHSITVIVGLIIALLVISPHVRAILIVGPEKFEGVYPAFNDDEIYYQARIKEAVEGNFSIGNPYLKEHVSDNFIMPPVAEWIIALVTRMTNASVPFVTSVSDFFCTVVDFILVYAIFLLLTVQRKYVSLLYTSLFFIFFLSTFGRPISPQLNSIFFLLGIHTILKFYFFSNLHNKLFNFSIGLITGITCFISPYYFSALLVFYSILFTGRALFEKSIILLLKNISYFSIAFIPCVVVYVFFQIKSAESISYAETILRYGLFQTHFPGSFTNVTYGLLTAGVVYLALVYLDRKNLIFCISIVMSIWILNLQNIITGKSLQFSSHYSLITILFVLMVLAVIHVSLFTSEKVICITKRKILACTAIVLLVLVISYRQKNEFIHIADFPYSQQAIINEQKKMEVFDWLNKNTESNSVVYTLGSDYDFLIPIYTENKVYYNFYVTLSDVPNSETEDRWLIQHFFDENVSTTTIRDSQRDYWGNRFIDRYQSHENRKKIIAFFTRNPYTPGVMIDESHFIHMYSKWKDIHSQKFENISKRYSIDFILLSEEYPFFENAKKLLEAEKDVTFLTAVNGERIYTVKNF